jgi:NAD(P)-dependent dehydrogenase (short-subunit alcohol dehydrogenase family)
MSSTFAALPSVKAQYDLGGRVCLITGGAGFLGQQFAEAVGEMGAVPVLLDLSESHLVRASDAVRTAIGRCEIEVADVSSEESLAAAVDRVVARHGRVDILINNAALTKYGCDTDPEKFFSTFENGSTSVWESGLRINLTGVMLACKVVGPVMLRQGKGAIINLGSDVGIVSPDQRIYEPDERSGYAGVPFNTPVFYSVSKAGVIHLTKHLATLWAKKGVRVNCFSPAGVYRDHDEAFVEKLVERIPMGRMGAINEYKGAIVFLASDASSFMTGHNLVMDGGRSIW